MTFWNPVLPSVPVPPPSRVRSAIFHKVTSDPKEQLLKLVSEHYLSSKDFNGVTLAEAQQTLGIDGVETVALVSELASEGFVDVAMSGHGHVNIHIKALDLPRWDHLCDLLPRADAHGVCLYPSPRYLAGIVNHSHYAGMPFSQRLALGEPQLRYVAFELTVLERYRNDPRYSLWHNDIAGGLTVRDANAESMRDPDRIAIQDFGFCYDDQMNRGVAVYLVRLGQLTPEHQQLWNLHRLAGEYHLHPDYYRSTMLGEFHSGISIFDATLLEMCVINEMAVAMQRAPLFRQTFEIRSRPQSFAFLIRPTAKEFNDFVHLLDKILSDNMNKDFFRPEVSSQAEALRSDGRIEVERKGSIRMLGEWLDTVFVPADPDVVPEMLAVLREVRRLRQKPAHAIAPDSFDNRYYHEQRDLMRRVYGAVSSLRKILANHPAAARVKIPIQLAGKIWTQ